MPFSKRVSAGIIAATGFALASVTLLDIYEDWIIQGDPLLSGVAENAVPLLVVGILPYAAWRLARSDRGDAYARTLMTHTLALSAVMLLVATWVVGIQTIQGKFKPEFIVAQTTTVAAVAGLLIGRKNAELSETRNTIEREKQRFQALFEEDPAGIADVRLEGDRVLVADANEVFEDLFGDVEGQSLADALGADAEPTEETVHDCTTREQRHTEEISLDTAAGRRHFKFNVVPYSFEFDSGQRRSYVILQDVTMIKETERRLEQTVSQLETSNEQLQQFAYVASHDLQEPLRMVSSYVDLLAEEYGGELDEEADEYIEYAVGGAERMQDMIDDLLQYARVRTQGEEFAEIDPVEILDQKLTDLEVLIEEQNATVTHDDLPTVRADANQLGQVFQNLVENAVEHGSTSPDSQARQDAIEHAGDNPEVHVSAEQRDNDVVFSVADNGHGIPEDQQERIFEIFEQGRRDDEGTGIGLSICQRIINRHGGDMWLESTEDEGTTFYFSIPRDATQQSTTLATEMG